MQFALDEVVKARSRVDGLRYVRVCLLLDHNGLPLAVTLDGALPRHTALSVGAGRGCLRRSGRCLGACAPQPGGGLPTPITVAAVAAVVRGSRHVVEVDSALATTHARVDKCAPGGAICTAADAIAVVGVGVIAVVRTSTGTGMVRAVGRVGAVRRCVPAAAVVAVGADLQAARGVRGEGALDGSGVGLVAREGAVGHLRLGLGLHLLRECTLTAGICAAPPVIRAG